MLRFQMDLQAIRLSSLEHSEQSEQVRIFLRLQFDAFPHCLSSGYKEYFWNDIKSVSSTSVNVSWVVKLRIHGRGPGALGPGPLFLDKTEALKTENKNVWRPVPSLMTGSRWPPFPSLAPVPLSEGLDLPLKDLNEPEKRILYIKEKTSKTQEIHNVYFSHKPLF